MLGRSLAIILLGGQLIAAPAARQQPRDAGRPSATAREDAYRANNIGVALLEQFKHPEGAEQFRRALQIDSSLAIARINLAIALYNVPDLPAALAEAKAAAAMAPDAPQPHYILGLIARAQNRIEDALAEFQRVLKVDPHDVGANVNLGQIQLQQRKYAEALAPAKLAFDSEPYNVTAAYTLANALNRSGQREEGQKMMQRFLTLRESGYATKIDKDYLDQGKYAEAISSTGAEPGLVDPAIPDVTFTDASASMFATAPAAAGKTADGGSAFSLSITPQELRDAARKIVAALGGAATLFDADADGDLDLFEASSSGQRLFRNDNGKFVDASSQAGALASTNAMATGVVSGDYDNDGKLDLFVLRYGESSLYHNDGNGRFSDVTPSTGIPAYQFLSISAAFVDVDHDGDLDIFIAGFADPVKAAGSGRTGSMTFPADFAGAPNLLLRNNGNGKFSDITTEAKVGGTLTRAVAVIPTDFDNRRDIDLLVVNFDAAPTLYRNLRDGSFGDVAAEVGLGAKGRFTSAAAGDVNKDTYADFYFGATDGPGVLAMSDGRGRFSVQPAPASSLDSGQTPEQDLAQFLDYDNDGLLDLLRLSAASNGGLRLWRNIGNNWADASDRAFKLKAGDATPPVRLATRVLTSGDIDGDGDTDLMVRAATGEVKLFRNEGGSRNRSLRVQLTGKASNRSGVGSKLEARAGSLRQKLEMCSASPAPAPADLLFGIGQRQAVDAVRVLWPSGIVQAEIEIPKGQPGRMLQTLAVAELDRKPSSCPYLYTWNGERFEFITDFMGGGEMGYWEAPGIRNHPDPDEYVRITSDQLRERGGRYEIRVTNELEEALYVDRLQLIALAHPADVEVYPNEGMTSRPKRFRLFATRGARPPKSALDEHGHDVLARVARLDRSYPDDFKLHRIRGYAEEHSLTLDLGASQKAGSRTVLLLTAWTDYAFSSDNVAAWQAGLRMSPPSLQVRDARGRWITVIKEIGIPVGRPQTVPVDLTGKFLSSSREVRILTNMRIYWDRILVDTSEPRVAVRPTRLEPLKAELRWRGFSAEVTPDGREPFGYDYDRVSFVSPWKAMPGRYTREGDVRSLISRTDDMFVISRPGDELAVSFDATGLPELPRGWTRTFLLYADGFSKEMDINSATPDQVMPLPFHGMTRYPYSSRERYPMTASRRAYIERFNTRIVRRELPSIDAVVAGHPAEGRAARLRNN
jgi:Flp pilus assembly protein TadD